MVLTARADRTCERSSPTHHLRHGRWLHSWHTSQTTIVWKHSNSQWTVAGPYSATPTFKLTADMSLQISKTLPKDDVESDGRWSTSCKRSRIRSGALATIGGGIHTAQWLARGQSSLRCAGSNLEPQAFNDAACPRETGSRGRQDLRTDGGVGFGAVLEQRVPSISACCSPIMSVRHI